MFQPIQFQVRLVHAESGNRVVEVRALRGSTPLGSALGEAAHAEEAEQRALERSAMRIEDAPRDGERRAGHTLLEQHGADGPPGS